MLVDYPSIFPLLRIGLESFVLILIGGTFILGESSLKTSKESTEKAIALYRLRPIFRFLAVFIFVLTAVIETDAINGIFSFLHGWKHLLLLIGFFIFLALMILFFGIVLPRALGEFSAKSIIAKITWPIAHGVMLTIYPIALMVDRMATRFLEWFGLSLHNTSLASDAEVIHMMDEGLHTGVFNASEKKMVERVLDLDDETVDALMTPRSEFVWLNLDDTQENNWCAITKSGHSEFPVFQGTHDHLAGIVSVKSLWANISLTGSVKLSDVITPPLYVPTTMTAPQLIEEFRNKRRHTALVVDEFGVVEGIVTVKDVLEAIVGILPEREVKQHYPKLIKKTQDRWLVDAGVEFKEARESLGIVIEEKEEEENRYQTIGGFFLHHLGHVPHEGESMVWSNFRFEVLKMNKHRIEQFQITKLTKREE